MNFGRLSVRVFIWLFGCLLWGRLDGVCPLSACSRRETEQHRKWSKASNATAQEMEQDEKSLRDARGVHINARTALPPALHRRAGLGRRRLLRAAKPAGDGGPPWVCADDRPPAPPRSRSLAPLFALPRGDGSLRSPGLTRTPQPCVRA